MSLSVCSCRVTIACMYSSIWMRSLTAKGCRTCWGGAADASSGPFGAASVALAGGMAEALDPTADGGAATGEPQPLLRRGGSGGSGSLLPASWAGAVMSTSPSAWIHWS
eukprot:9475710-Pyramimonas_sp.AAC.1